MTIYEQKLWFDSCAADTAVSLLILVLMCGGLAIGIRFVCDLWPQPSYIRIRTYCINLFMYFLWGVALLSCAAYVFDRGWERTVRLVMLGDNIEVQRCAARTSDRHVYPVADVAFDYHFEESYSRTPGPGHHLLNMRYKQTGEQVARLEMREGFDLQALRALAPRAWAAYQCQRKERRARDECRIAGSQPRSSFKPEPTSRDFGPREAIYAKSIIPLVPRESG